MPDSVAYNLYTKFHFMAKRGIAQMRQTGGAFQSLYRNAKLAQAGVRQTGMGLRQFAMFGTGAAAALGLVVREGVKFGKQFANVRAVVQATPKEFAAMREQAKHLGATTLFTAVQAAEGMEYLGRAGLSAKQVMGAISPALKLAIADNVELGRASEIVASSMNVFKIRAEETTRVADIFAHVSRSTMTNVTDLGESMKYAGTASAIAGQSFEDTMGTLGLLAQVGLRGSLAGTAYKNAMTKLAKGSEAAYKLFGGKRGFLSVMSEMTAKGPKFRRFPEIMAITLKRLAKIKNPVERAGLAFKIFGLRGIAGLTAFEKADPGKLAEMTQNLAKGAKGAAEQMAKIKQQSLWGQFMLLKSALTGVALELYDVFQPAILRVISGPGGLIDTLSDSAKALQMMHKGFGEKAVAKKYGETIAGVVFGVRDAFIEVGQTIKSVGKTVFGIFAKISGENKLTAKGVAKLITKFMLFSAALAPVIIGVGVLAMAFGGMFNVVIGGMKVLTGLTSRWGLVFMGLVWGFSGGQKKGESFISTMMRGMKNMVALANKLLWPFKQLAKVIGSIPTLMLGIMAFKGGKGLLARGSSMLAGSRNPLMRMFGRVGAAATGMPVFVTNWPMGGLGGLGGGAGMMGPSAAAMGRAGFFARAGAGARYLGMGGLGALAFGGKTTMAGTALAGTATAKTTALISATGTAATALGGLTAALAPAAAGLYALSKAYDPTEQKKLRDRLMKEQKKSEVIGEVYDLFLKRRDTSGKLTGFRSLEELKAETWEQKYAREARMKYGVGAKETDILKSSYEQARKGQIWEATGGTALVGGKLDKLYAKASEYELQKMGLTREMITLLQALNKSSSMTRESLARGFTSKVYLDGKEIAVSVAQHQQDSKERAGKTPTPGARRRALERGV
jgi:TP901 family phage tail tape measure protein